MAKYLDMNGVAYLLVRVRQIVEDVTSGALDLTDYVTKKELQKELNSLNINIDLSNYVTNEALATALSSYVKPSALAAYVKTSTLASYVKTEELEDYLQESDLAGYATESYVTNAINNAQLGGGDDGSSIDLSIYATTEAMNAALANKSDKTHTHSGYATTEYVDEAIENIDTANVDLSNYYTKLETHNAINAAQPDLSDFATEAYVNEKIEDIELTGSGTTVSYSTEEPTDGSVLWINPDGNVEEYATVAYVDEAVSKIDIGEVEVDLTGYAKTSEVSAGLSNKANVEHTHVMADITDYTAPTVDLTGYATETYVQEKIDSIEVTGGGVGAAGTGEGAEVFNSYTVNKATGRYSHAEGYGTKASGNYSHAEGNFCNTYSDYSHAEGHNTSASSTCQHVQGKYNVVDTNNKYAHIVGNGTNLNHSNAHTLDWNGNAWFAGKVYVGGTSMEDAVELGAGGSGSESVDLSNYYTRAQVDALIPDEPDLSAYALKTDIPTIQEVDLSNYYNKEQIDSLLANLGGGEILPASEGGAF